MAPATAGAVFFRSRPSTACAVSGSSPGGAIRPQKAAVFYCGLGLSARAQEGQKVRCHLLMSDLLFLPSQSPSF